MIPVEDFDLQNSPLEGASLIEASAGTGKTYAITGLFLRLILEKNLSVSEILVVTFTEAATEELKDRIRTRLLDAIRVFSGEDTEDTFLKILAQKTANRSRALWRLKEAVRLFDETSIHTIHGFCRKALHENAFESGSLFDTELVPRQDDFKKEIVEDFWRIHFYKASPVFVNYAVHQKMGVKNLFSLFLRSTIHPNLKIIPETSAPDALPEQTALQSAFDDLKEAWPLVRKEVEDLLMNHKGLNRNKYRTGNIPVWIQEMDRLVLTQGYSSVLFDGFSKFCAIELEASVKKNHVAPVHPFFYLCEKLKEKADALNLVFEQQLLGLKVELCHYLEQELSRRKRKKNILYFDDLLQNLLSALQGKGGDILARSIRDRYQAALIDEFQDTDPVQYAIFKKVFGVKNRILFLIGDPKQAIYGFRGADIFAYMDAAERAQKRYTLKENWRSEPDLIHAVNTIFGNVQTPFVFEKIPFHPVVPAKDKTDRVTLETASGLSENTFHLWYLNADEIAGHGKPISKTLAKEKIATAVAAEIARILNDNVMLGQRPVKEYDMAVLVRENNEARLMQRVLSEINIPSVLYSTDDLFASHEALEVLRVLSAMEKPDDQNRLRLSLATDMLGLKGEDIFQTLESEDKWEKWVIRFRMYHRVWMDRGFMGMFQMLLRDEAILSRLMGFPDGERRCTNLLHLLEVLHRTETDGNFGIPGLVKWLSEKRDPDLQGEEEHQLRLESDENAVRLITIHRSKGLEYPIVFCPFTWAGAKTRNTVEPVLFHDSADQLRATLDLGSENVGKHRTISETETLAENLRLLYVALTRAKNRCYLVWGRINGAETSALSYLFHQPKALDRENLIHGLAPLKELSHGQMVSDLETMTAGSHGAISFSEMPEIHALGPEKIPSSDKQTGLIFPETPIEIDAGFRISSFSSLVSRHHADGETPDHDPVMLSHGENEASDDVETVSGIFAFPKGAKAGTFMHDIFEHLDFCEKDTAYMNDLVAAKLLEHGFESHWQDIICAMVQNVLSVPLMQDRPELVLGRIPDKDRMNELGFYFPIQSVSSERLTTIFKAALSAHMPKDFPTRMETLYFSPMRGFMRGFVDMVFQYEGKYFLVDWKSNFLGNRISDYEEKSLNGAMTHHFYVLQYHIYCAALNQYLKLRVSDYDYKRDFGGVFYLFLRGMDPDMGPDYGIYRDRPSKEWIETFCGELMGV